MKIKACTKQDCFFYDQAEFIINEQYIGGKLTVTCATCTNLITRDWPAEMKARESRNKLTKRKFKL